LLISAESYQVAKAADYTAKQSETGWIDKSHGVHQYQQVNPLPFRMKLPGHFIGQKAPIAPASKEVWTLWLNGTQRFQVSSRDSLKWGWDWQAIKAIRF